MRMTMLRIAALAALAACTAGNDAANDTADATGATTDSAAAGVISAAMRDSAGRDLGMLTLSDATGGIMIMGTLRDLPAGVHAIHLHTTGVCEPTFDAAGGHWNPTSKEHGKDNPNGPHLGDMENITVGSDMSVSIHVTSPGGTLKGENMLLDADGAAVVIHATGDDYKSNPAGNAGSRIACGVVKGG